MGIENGFQVDQRVNIAIDALPPRQKASLAPLLRDKEKFVARTKRPRATRKLSDAGPLYSMKAGNGLRVIYSTEDDRIIVQDIMHKATLKQFAALRRTRSAPSRSPERPDSSQPQGD